MLFPEERLSRCAENLWNCYMILHRLLERETYFTRVQPVDPLSSCSLGRSLDGPSNEGNALLGVGEILAMEDLEFPVFLDKSVSDDSLVVECGPGDGR